MAAPEEGGKRVKSAQKKREDGEREREEHKILVVGCERKVFGCVLERRCKEWRTIPDLIGKEMF